MEYFDLAREARQFLENITQNTRETSQFCMLEGNKYTVLLSKVGTRPFRISSDLGEAIPIPWTASGRLLMAHMTDEDIMSFIPQADFTLPDDISLDPAEFISAARKASDEGFCSIDSVADNFTHCFAAPVRDSEGVCIATL
ncbi:MAG: IclR family transcriptional regulator domain-containing protein [Paracoccaceae bacterium]